MRLDTLLNQLKNNPQTIHFTDVIAVIEDQYKYQPTAFKNSEIYNEAGTNEGSCKIFAFAKLNQLTEEQTLHCFGDYYRKDVVENPEGTDHANIRNFITFGWAGITFESEALS